MNSEILSKLLADGLALMEPNDPARAELSASETVAADGLGSRFAVFFWIYGEKNRDVHGYGKTPEEALEDFKAKYTPPFTKENRIAELRAELAKLEGSK